MPRLADPPVAGTTGAIANIDALNKDYNRRYGVQAREFYADEDGAALDGVTDDTAKIQSILNRMTSGGTLYFPGLAAITGDLASGVRMGLRIRYPNTHLVGFGRGTGVIAKPGSTDPQILVRDYDESALSGISARRMDFINNTVFNTSGGVGIRLYRYTDYTVEDCYFQNCLTIAVEGGIPPDYISSGLAVRRCTIVGTGGKVPFSGVAVFNAEDVVVDGNKFDHVARPFDLEIGTVSGPTGVDDFSFCDNRVRNCTLSSETATNSYGGAHLTTQNGAHIRTGLISRNRFSNNNHAGTGIFGGEVILISQDVGGDITGVIISQNVSRDYQISAGNATQAALYLVGANITECEVVNNVLKTQYGTGSPRGIRLTDAQKNIITANRISGSWGNSYEEDGTALDNYWGPNPSSISPSITVSTSLSNEEQVILGSGRRWLLHGPAITVGPHATVLA